MAIRRLYMFLVIFLLLLLFSTSCSKEKEVSLPNIEVDTVQSLEIKGSGVNYDISIADRDIINTIIDWYGNVSEIKEEEYRNTFFYDPLLKLNLSEEEVIVIQADYQPDLIQITHIIGKGKGSTQVSYHGSSESFSQFIINLGKLKEETNYQSPTVEEISNIILDINSIN